MLSKEFMERMKDQLLDEKEKLTEELSETAEHANLDVDREDMAQEFDADEVNRDIILQLKADIKKIDDALARIEAGTYGKCAVGGEEISEARLEAIPWAEACAEHEGK